MRVLSSGITDVGLKREGNEDSFSVDDSSRLYIVCDGMGGHLAGEVASRVSVEIINKAFLKWKDENTREDEIYGKPDSSLSLEGNYLLSSIRIANRVVHEMALVDEKFKGMGTTVVLAFVTSTKIITANVGDSRIYLIRDGRIEGLSKDHTIVAEQVEMGMMTKEEAAVSPIKHVLTRNLGSTEIVDPDIYEIEPLNHDRFILCSDGLTDLVKDEEILAMADDEDDPNRLCREFVNIVLKRGAHDNTTVISIFLNDVRNTKLFFRKMGSFFSRMLPGRRKC